MINWNYLSHTIRLLLTAAMAVLVGSNFIQAENVFESMCVKCHLEQNISLRKTFMNALLVYSGKENMKAGLKYYLRHPRRDSSVMSEWFLDEHGVIKPLQIDDKKLDEALEIYWNRYTIQGKLQ